MTPVSVRLFFQQFSCSVMFFPFVKLLLNMSVNGILMTSDMTSSPRNDVAVSG